MAVRCCLKNTKDYDVYCGRGRGIFWDPLKCVPGVTEGWLGNPIVRGRVCQECGSVHNTSGDTLPCYSDYLKNRF